MFDAATAELIRSAPALEGVNPQLLPQLLTSAYADLAAMRLRGRNLADEPDFAARLETLLSTAHIYEALVDTGAQDDQRRAAAFVAATAYQVISRVTPPPAERGELLSMASVDPIVAAPLLFLVAEQSPDAREAARELAGVRSDDLLRTALLESVYDLASENFQAILDRAERLNTLRPARTLTLDDRASQSLYGLCWSGLIQLVTGLLGREPILTAFRTGDSPTATFDAVIELATRQLDMPGEGGILISSFSGPRHLAQLLKHAAGALANNGLSNLPTPNGAEEAMWRRWLRQRAKSKPILWPNHQKVIGSGFLNAGESAVLVLPTGAGKTTLSELKIAATLSAGRKVIFLVPTLALVDQLRDELAGSFPASVAVTEVSAEGDLAALMPGAELGNVEVMTPERCLALFSFTDMDVSDVGLLVFDECHLLSTRGGGARSIDAMLCLLHALKRCPDADFLLLSAMLQNPSEIADWLHSVIGRPCHGLTDTWKPSRQARGVVVYPRVDLVRINGLGRRHQMAKAQGRRVPRPPLEAAPYALFGLHNAWLRDAPDDTRIVRLLDQPVNLGFGANGATPNSNVVAASLATSAVAAGLKTIVFVQQADYAPSTATRLAAQLPPNGPLTDSETSLWNDVVAEFGGVQFSHIDPAAGALPHNGDMLPIERRIAESLFRRANGIQVIVATPTLAQGMNLPAQLAILAGTMRHDEAGRSPLEGHEILNAAGRAGRAGHLANGTVLLIPEPVASFHDELPSGVAFGELRALLPPNDQCLEIDDPLAVILDQISGGEVASASARYLLGRLRAGEAEDAAQDAAVTMVNRSFAAYRAREKGEEAEFDNKIAALRAALAGEADDAENQVLEVASLTGLPVEALTNLYAHIQASLGNLPDSIVGWSNWLWDFFAEDAASLSSLFGSDLGTLNAITRGVKKGDPPGPKDIDLLKAGTTAWLQGRPISQIELFLGQAADKIGKCPRSRDLILRIANRRLYIVAQSTIALLRHALSAAEIQDQHPALLDVLAFALRRGLDSPAKVAFAYRTTAIRTRVKIHQAFDIEFSGWAPAAGEAFPQLLQHVDVVRAFSNLDDLPDL